MSHCAAPRRHSSSWGETQETVSAPAQQTALPALPDTASEVWRQELEGAPQLGQLLGRGITAMLQERGSCHSPVVTSAGGVPRAGLCLAQHGLCGETGWEDNQNPSSSSSCRNSIPETAPAVPGRGGVSCCSSWSAASAEANLKAFSPCCGCCHRQDR